MWATSARAAASAYGPPEPMPIRPSSGSITSPVPETMNDVLLIGHGQQRLQPAQHPVAAPVLGQLDGGAREVAAILLELALEAREQREGIRRRAGEARHHAIVVQLADLAGAGLDDRLPQRHLTVAADRHLATVAHAEHVVA